MPVDPWIARGVEAPNVMPTLNALANLELERQRTNEFAKRTALDERALTMRENQFAQAQQSALDERQVLDTYAELQAVKRGPPEAQAAWLAQQAQGDPDFARSPYSGLPPEQALPMMEEHLAALLGRNAQTAAVPAELQIARARGIDIADPKAVNAYYEAEDAAKDRRAAASAAQVNVKLPPEESEEAKAVGKAYGEMFVDLQKSGLAATGKINRLDRLGQLLEGVATGKLTPATTQIAAYGQALGIKVDAKLGAKQAAQALTSEMALQLRNPSGGAGMPGALSDKDREFLLSMSPGLANTPEGNKLIIGTARKLAKRDQDVAKLATEYRRTHEHLDDAFFQELAEWSAANPLFSEAQGGGGPANKRVKFGELPQ